MATSNIQTLYAQIEKKSIAIKAVAEKTGRSYNGVKNHWLCDSGGWSVPEEHIEAVTSVLQNVIKNQ